MILSSFYVHKLDIETNESVDTIGVHKLHVFTKHEQGEKVNK